MTVSTGFFTVKLEEANAVFSIKGVIEGLKRSGSNCRSSLPKKPDLLAVHFGAKWLNFPTIRRAPDMAMMHQKAVVKRRTHRV